MSENKPLSEAVRELAYLPRGETYPLYSTMQQCLADEIAALEHRLAEAEAELSRKDECIVNGLMQRKDLQRRLAEATKFIQDIADGGGFTGAAAKDFLESTHD